MKIRFFILALFLSCFALANPPSEEGKTIFTARCAGCHNVNKTLTGPALAGIDQRRSMEWIVDFVHSSQAVIQKGDKDAIALFEKFNKIPMPDHKDLSPDHIKSIVEYIKSESASATDKAPFATPTRLQKPYRPIAITDYSFFGIFIGVVALLISGMLVAIRVRNLKHSA
jgi:mono/diheme cytochrome c family protein